MKKETITTTLGKDEEMTKKKATECGRQAEDVVPKAVETNEGWTDLG